MKRLRVEERKVNLVNQRPLAGLTSAFCHFSKSCQIEGIRTFIDGQWASSIPSEADSNIKREMRAHRPSAIPCPLDQLKPFLRRRGPVLRSLDRLSGGSTGHLDAKEQQS
jgi:hypothetical protein